MTEPQAQYRFTRSALPILILRHRERCRPFSTASTQLGRPGPEQKCYNALARTCQVIMTLWARWVGYSVATAVLVPFVIIVWYVTYGSLYTSLRLTNWAV